MCQIYSIQVVTHLKLKSQCKYKNREVIAQKRACSEIPYNQDAPPLPTCCSALLEALACIRNKNVHGLLSRATSCRIASLARQVCFFFFFTPPWPVASTGGKTPPRRAWGCTRYWIPLVHLILCMPFLWPISLCDMFRFGWIWLIAVEKQTRVDWWSDFYGLLWAVFRRKKSHQISVRYWEKHLWCWRRCLSGFSGYSEKWNQHEGWLLLLDRTNQTFGNTLWFGINHTKICFIYIF